MEADAVAVGIYFQQVGDICGGFSLVGVWLYFLINFLQNAVVIHGW